MPNLLQDFISRGEKSLLKSAGKSLDSGSQNPKIKGFKKACKLHDPQKADKFPGVHLLAGAIASKVNSFDPGNLQGNLHN